MEQVKKNRPNIKKRIIWGVALFVLIFCAVSMIAVKLIFNDTFGRGEMSEYTTSLRYADVREDYPRRPMEFYSGENRLQAYVYGEDNDKGLVVMSHGMGGGHEGYIPDITWFVDHGWRVFAFDNTGSCESEGESIVGLVQSALDLDAALTYIEGNEELSGLERVLYGHSWGGYAVTAVLNFDHDVAASASIAGYSEPVEMAAEWGKNMVGGLIYLEYPFLWLNNKLSFGEYSDMSAVDGINNTDVPVLIVHGDGDDVVKYNGAGIISRKDKIINPNVSYLTLSNEGRNGHNTVFLSQGASEYMSELEERYDELEESFGGELTDEAKAEFFGAVDKHRASEINPELIEAVNSFFEKAVAR